MSKRGENLSLSSRAACFACAGERQRHLIETNLVFGYGIERSLSSLAKPKIRPHGQTKTFRWEGHGRPAISPKSCSPAAVQENLGFEVLEQNDPRF